MWNNRLGGWHAALAGEMLHEILVAKRANQHGILIRKAERLAKSCGILRNPEGPLVRSWNQNGLSAQLVSDRLQAGDRAIRRVVSDPQNKSATAVTGTEGRFPTGGVHRVDRHAETAEAPRDAQAAVMSGSEHDRRCRVVQGFAHRTGLRSHSGCEFPRSGPRITLTSPSRTSKTSSRSSMWARMNSRSPS